MAYNPYDEEEEQLAAAGGAMAPAAQTGPQTTAQSSLMPSNSNKFINFSSYFNANPAAKMGDSLVSGLEGKATGAQQGASGAKQNVTTQANAGIVQGPGAEYTAPAPVVPPPPGSATYGSPMENRPTPTYGTKKQAITQGSTQTGYAQGQAGRSYTGPTADSVYQTFNPYMKQGTQAVRDITTAQDAAGVRALKGGSAFDATLTSAGAGGRKSELKQKYGGLMSGLEADRKAAFEAAEKAAVTSGENVDAWKKNAKAWEDYDASVAAIPSVDDQAAESRADAGAQVEKERANPGRLNPDERTNTISDEMYAMTHGLTLEEWIRAGKPNLQYATPEDIKNYKKGGG